MKEKDFVHLHNHTEYSLLDGAVRVGELITEAQKNNMSAVAITDHGVLYGIIDFYRRAQEAGIKPILGCEVYVAPGSRFEKNSRRRYHLILLAQNKKGYHNLIKIVSRAWLDGFYYKPRVDKDLLYEHRAGLIALSACIEGEVPLLFREQKPEQAAEAAEEYREIFGRENFFLELQDHNLQQEKKVNSKLISLAQNRDLPLVVTNDIHYLQKEDDDLHDLLLAMQTGTTVNDEDRMSFEGSEFYFKSKEEMYNLFPKIEKAYKNTATVAERCDVELDFEKFYLPDYPDIGAEETPAELLKKKCLKGLEERGLKENEQAQKRLEYELNIIEEMGYISYFLIVQDFVAFAERQEIRVGPGRGSAAGSLVSYLLGITKINPLEYGLIFERFLNPERVTMPDIDIDFDERRDEIIEYVKERYGEEKVAQIGTFGTMAARGAVRDVGRTLDIPYDRVDRVAKMIPASGSSLDEILEENKQLQEMYSENEDIKQLLDFARKVEGLPRHISTHAAGVIIAPENLTDYVPVQFQEESIITQLPMEELEDLGLLKMDFLGLRNLTIIEKTVDLVEKRYNEKIDIDNIALDDPAVYQMLSRGQTLGVFQMESRLFQDLNQKLRPERFEDLIALLALGRPGPLSSGLVEDYIKCRHGEQEPEYLHPSLKPILEETFGLMLYQEQVMQIASDIGGYSLGEADILRRGMGKKKPELIARERKKFVAGAQKKGIKKNTAHEIFDQMEYFAGYGFNKSHSAAYALLAYQTGYLKANYPSEFMSALLSTVMNNLDKIAQYIEECREMGIKVLPPDINESDYEFSPNKEDNIRFGLKAVKNLGKNAIQSIVREREKDGPYSNPADFLKRVDTRSINIRTLESLIKSGALDSLGIYRSRLLLKYEEMYQQMSADRKNRSQNQTSFFDIVDNKEDFFDSSIEYPRVDELDLDKKLKQEKEYLGIYVSGHPMDIYAEKIKKFAKIECSELFGTTEPGERQILAGMIASVKEHITRRNNRMAFLSIRDDTGEVDVTVFPDLLRELPHFPEQDDKVLVYGHCDKDDNFVAREIIFLEQSLLEINLEACKTGSLKQIKDRFAQQNSEVPVFFRSGGSLVLCGRKFWAQKDKAGPALQDIIPEKDWKLYN